MKNFLTNPEAPNFNDFDMASSPARVARVDSTHNANLDLHTNWRWKSTHGFQY
ncbi:MAG: hypothetical protein ACI97B_004900, partial [Verrucomicrobiales bacterium]